MKKFNKKDYFALSIIIGIFLIYVATIYLSGYVYGSTVDWESQHWAIPEYLRTLFYSTKNFFPSFGQNIGAGQNIFYLSYYGLFNPTILFSYFLPFLKMVDYIQIISILNVVFSGTLFYYWISKKYDKKVSFLATFIFVFSGPLIFHSHRHIMFVNYMPFLILSLIGVDRYIENKGSVLLLISVFLIIMSSYYFSVGALVIIFLYYINLYLKTKTKEEKIDFKKIIFFCMKLFIPILMSMILLLPTINVLLSGRLETNVSINLSKLFIPDFSLSFLLYKAYSLGLGALAILSLLDNAWYGKSKNRFLSIIMLLVLIFPIFIYILNGTMYLDAKALIPFLPVVVYLMAQTISKIFNYDYNLKNVFIVSLVIGTIVFISNKSLNILFIIDLVVIMILLYLYKKYKKNVFVYGLCLSIIISFITTNLLDTLVTKKQYDYQMDTYNYILPELVSKDNSYYRITNETSKLMNVNRIFSDDYNQTSIYSSTSNSRYLNLVRNVFNNEIFNKDYHTITQSNSILFNTYMGVKYIISDNEEQLDYIPLKETAGIKLYQNKNVLPIGYSSNKVMSLKEFNTLKYPYNVDAIMNYLVIDKKLEDVYNSNIEEYTEGFKLMSHEGTKEIKGESLYNFEVAKEGSLKIDLNKAIDNKIMIVKFNMNFEEDCKKVDSTNITINNQKNSLSCKTWKYNNKNTTFEYVFSSKEGLKSLDVNLSKGIYNIDNIKIYTMEIDSLRNIKNNISEFVVDKKKTKGDNIIGKINSLNDGYFNISIPYDKGFSIKVDGKKVKYEVVDTSFIGFHINKGIHNVEINYTSPNYLLGKSISLFGLILYIFILIKEKKNKRSTK